MNEVYYVINGGDCYYYHNVCDVDFKRNNLIVILILLDAITDHCVVFVDVIDDFINFNFYSQSKAVDAHIYSEMALVVMVCLSDLSQVHCHVTWLKIIGYSIVYI